MNFKIISLPCPTTGGSSLLKCQRLTFTGDLNNYYWCGLLEVLDGNTVITTLTISSDGAYSLTFNASSTSTTIRFTQNSAMPFFYLDNIKLQQYNAIAIVESYADYYPFGEKMPGRNFTSSLWYKYAYQGQEHDEETGLDAFELRLWDGRIGRWLSTDPYRQYHSPYMGMGNNPVNRIDPNGGNDDWYLDENGNKILIAGARGDIEGYTWLASDNYSFALPTYDFQEQLLLTDYLTIWWNSDETRRQIPDKVSITVPDINIVIGLGVGINFEFNFITRGDVGFFITNTISRRVGLVADFGVNIGASNFNGPVYKITKESYYGLGRNIDLGLIYGGNLGCSLDKNGRISWISGYYGFGLTIGASVGVSNTNPDFHHNHSILQKEEIIPLFGF